jgi:anaerobic carbon-monoxide dehydrogenase iron sulfur subunit
MPHIMIMRKRCTGCHMCELACSAFHEGAYRPTLARLAVECDPTTAAIKGRTCLQSACAKCEDACPEGAIVRREISVAVDGDFAGRERLGAESTGVVLVVDESRCTNCGECYAVCPYGVILEHPERKKALKCDLCDGEPQCVAFCQNPHILAVDLKIDKADASRPAPSTAG